MVCGQRRLAIGITRIVPVSISALSTIKLTTSLASSQSSMVSRLSNESAILIGGGGGVTDGAAAVKRRRRAFGDPNDEFVSVE